MQRRSFLALLAGLPMIVRAQATLDDLQAEARRRTGIFLAQVNKMASDQPAATYFNAADPVFGAQKAKRTVLVFTDFNCPYCRKIDATLQQVAREGEVRFVLKWQAIMADSSAAAANYAMHVWRTARPQYPDIHAALMQAPLPITQQAMRDIARHSKTEHLLDLTEPEALAASVDLGKQLRIFATPSMLIGNRIISGMTDAATLKSTIKQWPSGG
ncbi:thioredoxin domain-containing protein [Deefgea rivuli]|uniref:thioredoxin domain-containing protein n=1 Tax=Deefgea rivuli TaxID=400948 RepID=UPI000486C50D|nr:thioredoxin domain-containing protein [Deefgea rivuli]